MPLLRPLLYLAVLALSARPGTALAQDDVCYTGIKMPWQSHLPPCPDQPPEDPVEPVKEPECYTGIKMPWHSGMAQCDELGPNNSHDKVVPGGECFEGIRMPWHEGQQPCEPGPPPGPPEPPPGPLGPGPGPEPSESCPETFVVGDTVDVDPEKDGQMRRGTVIDVYNMMYPSYIVQFADGTDKSVFCENITAAMGEAPPEPPPPQFDPDGPPLGEYFCQYGAGRQQVLGPGRFFHLMPGGEYRADDDEVGSYAYDSATGKLTFEGGFFGHIEATGDYVGNEQIDINAGLLSYCTLQ